jgi:antitoxin FitA
MLAACAHASGMNKHIQIKNVEVSLHRKLKIRAIENGMSLSDYLKKELAHVASRPTNKDVIDGLKKLKPVALSTPSSQLVREDRDTR